MIHCQKCKHQNAPEVQKCSQCGANLLPGQGIGTRLLVAGISILLGIICCIITIVIPSNKGGGGFAALQSIGLLILGGLIGLGAIIFGIYWLFRKTSLQERYQSRAERHKELDPWQAIADYSTVLELESIKGKKSFMVDATDVLIERGSLYQKQGKETEAREDLERALNKIKGGIASSKEWETGLQTKLLQVSHLLGLPDPELEVLSAVIRAAQIPGKDEESVKYRTNALQTLNLITMSGEYGIVGYCENCGAEVLTESVMFCKNNIKHKQLTNQRPVRLRSSDEDSAIKAS